MKTTTPNNQELEDELVDTNQTEFAENKPAYDPRKSAYWPFVGYDPANPYFQERQKRTKYVIIFFVPVILVMIYLMALVADEPTEKKVELKPSPTVQAIPAQHPLRVELKETRQQLNEADPTKQDLPFPPLKADMGI